MRTNARGRFMAVLVAATALVLPHPAWGQDWVPQRHVELIVPAPAGGSLDATGRMVHRIWQELKLVPSTSAIVNRGGGGHAVAYTFLNQQAGDPHYLSITSPTLLTSHINGRIPLTYTDFTPLATLVTEYIGFAVRSESPLQTGKDLVEALRKTPGGLSLALSSARGGTHHISVGLPLQSAGIDANQVRIVAFNSSSEAMTALLGGHVDVISASVGTVVPHVEAGKLRVLVVTSAKRLGGALAAAPTWPELGYKGVFENWRGVIGTKGLTPEQSAFWERAFRRVAASEEFQIYAQRSLWDVSFRGPAETRKFMVAQYDELKGVMSYLGLVKQ
jgi:putative tricarboxylic transport membrane protein